jgi:hypothetical protein
VDLGILDRASFSAASFSAKLNGRICDIEDIEYLDEEERGKGEACVALRD